MSRRTSRTGALTLALLLLPGLSLVGCSSDDEPDQDAGPVLESPTGTGEVPDPDALPDGYPEADAPVIAGELVSTASEETDTGTSFNILVSPDSEVEAAVDEAVAKLVDKGWKDNSTAGASAHVLVKGADTAVIQAIDDEADGLVSYNIVME
ncbi:hypothetical protein [Nocardioides pacificus]